MVDAKVVDLDLGSDMDDGKGVKEGAVVVAT